MVRVRAKITRRGSRNNRGGRGRRKSKASHGQFISGRYFVRKSPGVYKSIVNNAVEMWLPGAVTSLTASSSVISTNVSVAYSNILSGSLMAQIFTEYVILTCRMTVLPTIVTDNGYVYCQFNEKDTTAITSLIIAESSDAFPIMLNQGGGQNSLQQFDLRPMDFLDNEYRDTESGGTVGSFKFYGDANTINGLGASDPVARVKLDFYVRFRGRNNESASKQIPTTKIVPETDPIICEDLDQYGTNSNSDLGSLIDEVKYINAKLKHLAIRSLD